MISAHLVPFNKAILISCLCLNTIPIYTEIQFATESKVLLLFFFLFCESDKSVYLLHYPHLAILVGFFQQVRKKGVSKVSVKSA